MTDYSFSDTGGLHQKELLLSQAYFENQSAGQLVDLASRLLGNPVMLLDSTYQCLAYAPKITLGVQTWDTITQVGYMQKDLVLDMGRYFTHMTDSQRRGAYIYEAPEVDGRLFRKIVSALRYEKLILGGIAVAEFDRPITEEDIVFTDYLCKVMGSVLYKEGFLEKNLNQNLEQLFFDLLAGSSQPIEVLQGRLEALGLLSVQAPYYLIYVDILPVMKDNVEYLRIKLHEAFPHFFTVFFQDALLIIGNILTDQYETVLEQMNVFLSSHYLYGCISNPFHSLPTLREHFDLVRHACSIGQMLTPEKNLFEFNNLSLYCLLQKASGSVPIQNYLHPGIRILKSHDRDNGTEYHRTLILYLENNLNVLATANALFIHRNTLSYRLKKIEQLLIISMEERHVLLNLLLAELFDDLQRFEEPS